MDRGLYAQRDDPYTRRCSIKFDVSARSRGEYLRLLSRSHAKLRPETTSRAHCDCVRVVFIFRPVSSVLTLDYSLHVFESMLASGRADERALQVP